jgi:TPM domain
MLLCIFRTALILAGVCWLAGGGTVAAASAVKDESRVFSPQVKEQAEKEIEEISRLYYKDLIIEFVPSVPEGNWWNKVKKWMLYSKDPKNRQRFYEDWAKRNARAAGPRSIYVLIVKEPAPLHVEIAAGRDAQKKDGLTPGDCKKLQERLQIAFQKGHYDAGLEETIKDIVRTLRDNRDAATVPPEQFPWAELGSLMAIMLGFWLCLQLMQKFLGNRDPERAVPLEAAGYGAGGSYLAGLYATLTSNGVQELFRSLRSRERPAPEPVAARAAASADDHEVVLTDAEFGDSHHHAAEPQDYIHDKP